MVRATVVGQFQFVLEWMTVAEDIDRLTMMSLSFDAIVWVDIAQCKREK